MAETDTLDSECVDETMALHKMTLQCGSYDDEARCWPDCWCDSADESGFAAKTPGSKKNTKAFSFRLYVTGRMVETVR